jgi:triosephosphate isomerase (TIM)
MKARKPLVVGNWKMNGDSVANDALLSALRDRLDEALLSKVDVAVCPPFPYLGQTAARLSGSGIAVGSQDVSAFGNGAYTGDVSAEMLVDLGSRWTIIGHSERRTLFGETDETVARKAGRALGNGLGVIVCVGETLEQRESGRAEAAVAAQIDAIATVAASADVQRFVVAYEPVWAIGTGRTAGPEQAQEIHQFVRTLLRRAGAAADALRILYGGSVKPGNAGELLGMPDIDGGLIGGASLVADDFVAIVRVAAHA